jgi:hypothetical protein
MLTGRRHRWDVPQLVPFARAFSRCAFRPALARAVPLYAVALLVSGAPIGALALNAASTAQPVILPAIAAAWVLALARVRAPLFGAVQTEYLRSMPVAGSTVIVGVLAALLCIDAPWIWLCVATRNPAFAAGPALTLAGHAALASRRFAYLLALAGVLGFACVVPLWLVSPPALGLAVVAVPWAWTVAPVARIARTRHLHRAVPSIGIARALVSCVVRADAELLRRSLAILVAMTAIAALVVRNNRLDTIDPVLQTCLVVLALGVPIVLTRVAVGVLEVGWTVGWLYDAVGVRRLDRSLGGLAAALASGGALGLLHGIAVSMWSDSSLAWRLGPAEAVAGGGFAVVLLGVSAGSVTARGIDPIRLVAAVVMMTSIAAFTLAAGLRYGVAVGVPAVVLAAFLYHLRVNRAAPCS